MRQIANQKAKTGYRNRTTGREKVEKKNKTQRNLCESRGLAAILRSVLRGRNTYLRFDRARLVVLEVKFQLGLAVIAGTPELRELVLPDDGRIGALGQGESSLPVEREPTRLTVV